MTQQEYESRVPPRAVRILRDGDIERLPGASNQDKEVWEVKDYTVTMITGVRAYNCTCRFGSVHADKDGICKHVAAVELYKTANFMNPKILEEIKEADQL